jgi:hypothetical protein
MSDKVSKKEILVFAGIIVAMVGSLVYGFFMVGVGEMPENSPAPLSCWDKYQTEEAAILNCEGENE